MQIIVTKIVNLPDPLVESKINGIETRGKTNKGKFLRAARH